MASFEFKSSAPISASDDNAATNLNIWHSANIYPFRFMACLSCGVHPRNKYLAARFCASLDDKYDTSEWEFRSMPDA